MSRRRMRGGLALASAGLLVAVGCASASPPREVVSQAQLSIDEAQQAGAQQHAPLELYQAREQFEEAKRAMEKGDNEEARRLAERSLASAQLARARARTAQARQDAEAMKQSIDTLRAELAAARGTRSSSASSSMKEER